MRVRTLLGSLAVVAFLALLTYGLVAQGSSGPEIGDRAPVNELEVLGEDETAGIDQHRGKWRLVNFWASWCEPCRDEAPLLERLQRTYAGEDFTVIGIATRDLTEDAQSFAEELDLTYPQLRDGEGSEAQAWGTTGVPESFLVDPRGVVRDAFRGPVDAETIRERFLPQIRAGLAASPDRGATG